MNHIYYYPGSFAPLHYAHLSIANYVEQKYKNDVIFEICKTPYDKPNLTEEDINNRLEQFSALARKVVVTEDKTFLNKAMNCLYRVRCTGYSLTASTYYIYFIVGYDTISRIDDKKYYFNCEKEKERCLNIISSCKVKFLVFPRNNKIDEGLSEQIKEMCLFERDFVSCDISSSSLRMNSNLVKLCDIEFGRFFEYIGSTYKNYGKQTDGVIRVFNGQEFLLFNKDIMVKPRESW